MQFRRAFRRKTFGEESSANKGLKNIFGFFFHLQSSREQLNIHTRNFVEKRKSNLDFFFLIEPIRPNIPTNLFPILEPRDQEIGELYVVQDHRATDFEATKL